LSYNARFSAAKQDTYLREEEDIGLYLQGLTSSLMDKVVGARTICLADTMRAANDIYAQMSLLPGGDEKEKESIQGKLSAIASTTYGDKTSPPPKESKKTEGSLG
jgi:hypothetical protein